MTLLIIQVLAFLLAAEPAPVPLKVEITNLKNGNGKLWLALFRPQDKFGEGKPNIYEIIEVHSKADQAATFQLEPGKYALAVYHDLNGNDLLDKNFIGIPKEPYGFSNDFRPRFSPPKFKDCAFDVPVAGRVISVKMTD